VKKCLGIALCAFMWAVGTFEVRSVKAASDPVSPPALTQTAHPPISRDASALWLAPTTVELRLAASDPFITLKTAIQALKDGRGAEALRLMTPLVDGSEGAGSPLDHYVAYYAALADFGLSNLDRARDRLQDLRDEPLEGYLAEAAALAEAEVAEAQSEFDDALKIYEKLSHEKPSSPDAIWMKLGHAAYVTGERSRAADAYTRVYYDFPLSDLAADARAELDRLEALEPLAPQNARYRLDLGRAERMFVARRYADAQSAYEALKLYAVGDDRDLIALRLAECDYFRGRYRQARESLRGLISDGPRQGTPAQMLRGGPREAEARYFYARALDRLRLTSDAVTTARKLIDQFPDSSWAEDALNDLATGYVRQNNEAAADGALRELYAKFPAGRYAARAAWKIGWRSYRAGRYLETVSYFDLTARQFPRSDYRPAFLYWSGRAHEAMGDRATAAARYTLATADYLNTYYGRVASRRLVRRGEAVPSTGLEFVSAGASPDSDRSAAPPTAQTIRSLLAVGLYDDAMNELQYAGRTWGDTSVVKATTSWIYIQQGNFRDAIVAMKRAYPQYMASGGELMPEAVLKVIFPVDYWNEIQAHAARHELSPYFLAALVAQESAFDAKVRSSANAVGLMQLIPSTGRLYARRLKLGPFSTSMLTNPKTNMTMGSAYMADLMKKFGKPHLALAAYNAGDGRVARWLAERQGEGLDQEEFIDDIPFAETQNYVKRVLSTTEDYRRLYGDPSRSTQ
jgi:soluble lytic murein transglycosylase